MIRSTGDPVWRCDSPAARIAIIAALDLEAEIPRSVGQGAPVYVSGPGRERAHETACRAISTGARALIAFGLAGGLSRDAGTASVVLPQTIASDEGVWTADAPWRLRLAQLLRSDFRLIEGRLFSADDVVATPEAKAELARRAGAAVVDMESAAIAAAAAAAGLPCIAFRVVADGPDDTLPDNVASLVGPDGKTRLRGMTGFLMSPRRMRLLLRLAARSRDARSELRRATQFLVRSAS
jgi:adenosylhomocysteine nucleosidase